MQSDSTAPQGGRQAPAVDAWIDVPGRSLRDRLMLSARTKDGALRVSRRIPWGLSHAEMAVAAVGFALLALGGHHPAACAAWCIVVVWFTGFNAHVRARRRVVSRVVAPMRRALLIAPKALHGHRGAATVSLRIDGREILPSSLKRVSIERLLVRTAQPGAPASEVPRRARVILVFEQHAVVLEHASSVEGAVALADAIAAALGLVHDLLPDRVERLELGSAYDRPEHRFAMLTAGINFDDAHDDAHTELPFRRAAPFALLRLAVLLGGLIGLVAAVSHPLAEHPRWGLGVAAAIVVAWLALDTVVVRVGAWLFRDDVLAAVRQRYGFVAA